MAKFSASFLALVAAIVVALAAIHGALAVPTKFHHQQHHAANKGKPEVELHPVLVGGEQEEACPRTNVPPFNDATYYAEAIDARNDPDELRAVLSDLLMENFVSQSYSCIWDVLTEADAADESGKVWLLYSQEAFPASKRDNGGSEDSWNREHVWVKSHGFPSESSDAYTDAHHLRACYKPVNTKRNDRDFHGGGNFFCVRPYGASESECEVSATIGPGNTFGVPEGDRGHVARMIFYMEARYTGQNSASPHLTIVNRETRTDEPNLGFLCELFRWHLLEPVNNFERQRNDVIYKWQGNRNPFIDHPEWVNTLWGSYACEDYLDQETA